MASKEAPKRRFPQLPGWEILPVAADRIGLSRQWLHDMARDGKLGKVYELAGTGARPAAIMVRSVLVDKLIAERAAAQACPQCREAAEQSAAAGMPVDVTRMLCEHGKAEPVADPDVDEALGVPV